MSDITIIIPAYNEQDSIAAVIEGIRKIDRTCELIVIDDASQDNTGKIAKESASQVIRNSYNKGYGGAIKAGVRLAKSEVIGLLDGDGQHSPEDLFKLYACLDGYDMVVGVREQKQQLKGVRGLGRRLLVGIAQYLVDAKIPDINCGLRVIRKEKILEFMHILPNGFSLSTTLTLALLEKRYDINFVPINHSPRKSGKSTVNIFKDGLQALLLICRIIVLFNPLKIFAPASLILFAVGFFYAVFSILFKQFHVPSGAILLILSSLVIFFFGILADQISSLRKELR